MAATNVGSIAYTLELDTNKFDSSIKALKSKLSSINTSLGSVDSSASKANGSFSSLAGAVGVGTVAADAFTRAIGGIGQAIGSSFNQLKSLETSRASFEVLTGSAEVATATIKDLAQFANTTPFEFPDLAKSAKTLLGFGLSANDTSKRIRQIGDISAATGGDLSGIATVVGQIFAAGKVNGQDFLQLINNSVALGPEIAKELGVPLSDVKNQIEKGAVSADVFAKVLDKTTDAGGKFFGGTDKLAGTLDGRISTLKDTFTGLVGSLVGVDFSTGLVEADGLFAKLSTGIKSISETLSQVDFSKLGKSISEIVTSGIGVLKNVFSFIVDNKDIIISALSGFAAGFVALKVIKTITSLVEGFGLALKFLSKNPVVLLIGLTVAALVLLEKKFGAVTKAVKIISENFSKFRDAIQPVTDKIGEVIGVIKDAVFDTFKNVIKGIGDTFNDIQKYIDDHKEGLKQIATVIGVVLLPAFAQLVTAATVTAIKVAASAAVASAGWVANAATTSAAWALQFGKIVFQSALTATKMVAQAVIASAGWVANAAVAGFAWLLELPKIVAASITTSAAAVTNALISSAAWVASAVVSSTAWLINELPKIILAFVTASGSAVVNAGIASASWVASATVSSQAFIAFRALLATPLVMPAIVVTAAIASLFAVVKAVQAVKDAIDSVNNAAASAASASKASDSTLATLNDLIKNGTPEQQARARSTFQRLSETGAFANGTNFAPGGIALVGEEGPELVNLPRGSKVVPADRTSKILQDASRAFSSISLGVSNIFSDLSNASSSLGRSPSTSSDVNPGAVAGVVNKRQVIIAAVPINGIQLSQEQLRDFYRQLTTAYGDDLGAII